MKSTELLACAKRRDFREWSTGEVSIIPATPSNPSIPYPIGSMVLLYMVCHGSHQYIPFMLALIYQHHGSVMGTFSTYTTSWFTSPSNYSYLRTINHSYWSDLHQVNAIERGPHIVWLRSQHHGSANLKNPEKSGWVSPPSPEALWTRKIVWGEVAGLDRRTRTWGRWNWAEDGLTVEPFCELENHGK